MTDVSALDKLSQLEERVDDQLNRAEAMSQLEQGTLENRFRQLENQTNVDAELEELKRQLFGPTIEEVPPTALPQE